MPKSKTQKKKKKKLKKGTNYEFQSQKKVINKFNMIGW